MITHNFAAAREEFAADRKKVLTDAAAELRDHVRDALSRIGLPGWESPVVDAASALFTSTARAEVDEWSQVMDDMREAFGKELADALAKTKKAPAEQAENQLSVVTAWVAQMAHNAAIEAATTADPNTAVGLEWVTMHDAGVREAHREADGQTVPTGHEFTVGGEKMLYPGQPVGDPGNWINCRCLARPTMLSDASARSLTASAAEPSTSAVIVALPAESDPASAISSEADGAHCTLLFLGDATAFDPEPIKAVLAAVADGVGSAVNESVSGAATLGPNQADVVLLDAAHLADIRGAILATDEVRAVHDGVQQFPTWIPHVTLGYPETPRLSEETPAEIKFDRLALWYGEDRTAVYPLGAGDNAVTEDPEKQAPLEAALAAMRSLTASAGEDPAAPAVEQTPEETDNWDEEMASMEGADQFSEVPWYGVLAPEGVPSGDGREFLANALTNRPLPLPLKFMWEDDEGHKGSFPVGRIDRIWRENGLIKAEGVFDTSEAGYEAIRLLANQIMRGVSVDLDSAVLSTEGDGSKMQFSAGRICSATICAIPAFAEAFVAIGTWADEQAPAKGDAELPAEGVGSPTPQAEPKEAVAAGDTEAFDIPPVKTMDGPGWITEPKPTHRITSYWVDGRGAAKIGWGIPGDFNRCRVNLAKYVQNPSWLAGLCANLHYRALGVWPGKASAEVVEMHQEIGPSASLVASAAPAVSADYFRNPMLEEPTPVTLGEDGHIFGHLAEWGTCHIGFDACITPPESATDYAYFLTGQVFTDAGPVAVGQLTVGGGHAKDGISLRAAVAHYDNVATAVADITVGEDAHGVWFSGRVRPWATEQQLHELFAAGPSGDWREVRSRGMTSLELVAAHAVNVQGFPVPRPRFAMESGRQVSLVAAGALVPAMDRTEQTMALVAELRDLEFSRMTDELTAMKGL